MPLLNAAALGRARDLAVRAARAPREIILASFRSTTLVVESKGDGTPVTAADREAELAIRHCLRGSSEFGRFGILGEEGGADGEEGRYRWIVDPIDGTRGFARGLPTFGTLIALEETTSERALIGVIHLPLTDETLAGARGLGATRNGRPIRASQAQELRSAVVSLPDFAEFRAVGMESLYGAIHAACDHVRGYTDCWAHAMVVAGAVDAMIDPGLSPWDVRATEVLIAEAGGASRLRRSRVAGKSDLIVGSPGLVEQIARMAGFYREGG
jgi:histidinol phosphatase-like enzyme (inositol monophosphatase family)